MSNFLRALRAAGINGDTLNRASQTAHEEPSEGSLLSDAGVTLPRDNDYTLHLKVSDPDEVRFFRGDLTEDPSDAIVNAANSDLLPGGGLCGAINYKGGAEIFRECGRIRRSKGPLAPGGAVPTTAGQLPSKYVIHAVGPVWEGGTRGEAGILARCYRESMRVADDLALHSIAFPAISTGMFQISRRPGRVGGNPHGHRQPDHRQASRAGFVCLVRQSYARYLRHCRSYSASARI